LQVACCKFYRSCDTGFRGGIEPWLMARWKARIQLPIRHSFTFLLALTVEVLQGKTCQDSLLSGGSRSVRAKISGGRGCPWGIFFRFYKTRHILLSDSANCTVLRDTIPACDRQTDGWTDGTAVASTALAKRALRRAVKTEPNTTKARIHRSEEMYYNTK